jgi:UDP-glucose 4-epimerase
MNMLTHRFAEPVKPGRVVLLGAGGFLSPVLKRLLEREGISVLAVGSKDVDLCRPDAGGELAHFLQAGDVVVMAAALTPDKGKDIATLMKNLRMAENVCAAIKEKPPVHFLYVSSDGVYDGKTASLLDESSSCEPTDLYTLMHIAREKMLDQTCREAKVPIAVVRPCAIYGEGDTHNSYGPNRFIRTACANGKITLFGGGEEKRHHVHVNDVAKIIHLCLSHGSTGVLNAVTGEAIAFAAIAELVRSRIGREVIVECLPRSSPITHRHFDPAGLAKAFPGFQATPFEEGLGQALKAALSPA